MDIPEWRCANTQLQIDPQAQHWARIEAKSPTTQADLARQIEDASRASPSRSTAALTALLFSAAMSALQAWIAGTLRIR